MLVKAKRIFDLKTQFFFEIKLENTVKINYPSLLSAHWMTLESSSH